MPVLDANSLIDHLCDNIRAYHDKAGLKQAQLDVSGGLDSAVVLGLLAKALGPENVVAVYSDIQSSKKSRFRAREVANHFGVLLIEIDLNAIFDNLITTMGHSIGVRHSEDRARYDIDIETTKAIRERIKTDPTILGSIRSCIRAPIGRGFGRMMGNALRHGTGNECEDRFLRFYQKGGDGEVDCQIISELSKAEVAQIAVKIGVPKSIVEAKPSPDLWGTGEDDHNDEDELKAITGVDWTYSRVDPETGEYTYVGTIERMNRLLDTMVTEHYPDNSETEYPFEKWLFRSTIVDWNDIEDYAAANSRLDGFGTLGLLKSARHMEQASRHKQNSSVVTLAHRADMLEAGLITDELPKL